MSDLVIRPREDRDDGFVYDRWLKSFRDSHAHGPIPPDLYWLVYREVVQRLLARPSVVCSVLESPSLDLLVGFIAHEPDWQRWSRRRRQLEEFHVVHYLYVNHGERGFGLARRLLDDAGVRNERRAFSFSTVASRGVLGDTARFMPDAARFPSATGDKREGSQGPVRS